MGKIKHIQYIHLPYIVLKDESLIHNEKLVLSNIISVITGGGQYRFDNSFIADYLNCSTRTASRIVSSISCSVGTRPGNTKELDCTFSLSQSGS